MPTVLPSIFLTTLLLLFLCLLFPLTSPLLFPCARYPVWDTLLLRGIPISAVHATWSLVFRCFGTSSQRLKTAQSLVYNNNGDPRHTSPSPPPTTALLNPHPPPLVVQGEKLLSELKPTHVVMADRYSKPPPLAPHRTDMKLQVVSSRQEVGSPYIMVIDCLP